MSKRKPSKKARTRSAKQERVIAAADAITDTPAQPGEPPTLMLVTEAPCGIFAIVTQEGAGLLVRRSAHKSSEQLPIEYTLETFEGVSVNPNIIAHWHGPIPEFPPIPPRGLLVRIPYPPQETK